MKAFKVLAIVLLAIFSFSTVNAQMHQRVYKKRHHVIVKHRRRHY